jgi:hypothetical protein
MRTLSVSLKRKKKIMPFLAFEKRGVTEWRSSSVMEASV